jgi:hypothetical protein
MLIVISNDEALFDVRVSDGKLAQVACRRLYNKVPRPAEGAVGWRKRSDATLALFPLAAYYG